MTQRDDELLSQYLDGELDAGSARHLEQRLEREPGLRGQLNAMRRIDEQLCDDAARHGEPPVRARALLATHGSNVLPFTRASASRRAAGGLAIAASLIAAAGLLLAPQWRQAQDGAARAELVASALDATPSSAEQWTPLHDGSELRPVLSFAATSGQWCREYRLRDDSGQWHGVACRDSQGWHTEILVDAAPAPDTGPAYQPAGAGDIDAISGFISANAADIPVSAGREEALIADSWQ